MTPTPPSPARPASGISSSQGTTSKPSAPPVNILPTPLARIYSLLHPVLLPSILAIRFHALVADPVAEMLNALPFLALLQVSYVMICLPPAGSGSSKAEGGTDGEEKRKSRAATKVARRKTHSSGIGISAKLTPALLSLILTALLATPVLSVLLVLFGAPLTTHQAQTVLCGAHMALLAATALIYVHGVDGGVWREVWGFARPADAVWGGALGMGVGAWFGAVPIPLDWDRPWQAFPITILTGAYLGFAVGSLISRSSWMYGKRLEIKSGEQDESKKTE